MEITEEEIILSPSQLEFGEALIKGFSSKTTLTLILYSHVTFGVRFIKYRQFHGLRSVPLEGKALKDALREFCGHTIIHIRQNQQ